MKNANEYVKEMQRKRKLPSSSGRVSQDHSLPIVWLHPKDGHHINSLDSLQYHEDLVKDYLQAKNYQHQPEGRKEIIRKALYEKNISQWEGVVSEILSDRKGIICLKRYINVSFVPVNVHPFIPNTGDVVRFCLAFHWTGPHAWFVVCGTGEAKAMKAGVHSSVPFRINPCDDDSGSEESDTEGLLPLVGPPLYKKTFAHGATLSNEDDGGQEWCHYLDQELQGIISKRVPDGGYGNISHPKFQTSLFFHLRQIVPPVDSLHALELYSVVSFTVGRSAGSSLLL